MDIRKIRKLIELVEETGVSELEIKEGEESVRISLGGNQMVAPQALPTNYVAAPTAAPVAEPTSSTPAAARVADEPSLPEGHVVTSPMVGTMYRAPSPEAAPFVEKGKHVKAGETLCIVEAMKLFNEIESEVSGTIVKVLVEDAQPIEYDQALFLVDPNA